jgi:hypothetical protein
VFHGQWKNNLKHGKFKIKYQNGESYVGDYRNNKKHGRGVYVYSNTESYTGEYRNGKKHGQGIYRFINGIEKRGLWSEDILVENPLSGHGKSVLSRGISMRSLICNEQKDEKEDDEDGGGGEEMVVMQLRNVSDHSISLSSSSTATATGAAVAPSLLGTPPRGNPYSNSPHRSRKTVASSPSSSYRSPSPNRARSCSDGSDGSSPGPSLVFSTSHHSRHQSPLRRTARL